MPSRTLVFGQNSELYQKLVVREQKLDSLGASAPSSVDPDLFTIRARLKRVEDLPSIRAEILAAVKRFQDELIPADKLEAVKKRERYSFTMRLDNSESVPPRPWLNTWPCVALPIPSTRYTRRRPS